MRVKMHLYREIEGNFYKFRWYPDDPDILKNLDTNPFRGTAERLETAIIDIPEGYTEEEIYWGQSDRPRVGTKKGWMYLKKETIWKK